VIDDAERDQLRGGHIIKLGAGNDAAALEALGAFPGGMQLGGGVNLDNALQWLEAGASHVIVTSWIFREGRVEWDRLNQLVKRVGKEQLVLDLSCRKKEGEYYVVTDRWQNFTDLKLNAEALDRLATFCDEFLVHAVDVEGLCLGIDHQLVENLAVWTTIPTTYAGGAKSLQDLEDVSRLGMGKIHLTIGSALDIFGGSSVRYEDCVAFNRRKGLEGSKSN
jgi:phosphoribosylformimino-5-aminoimidazole carboxamide ribotide isomerase